MAKRKTKPAAARSEKPEEQVPTTDASAASCATPASGSRSAKAEASAAATFAKESDSANAEVPAAAAPAKESDWWLYILNCADATLYTGITTDVERRVSEHNAGTGAKYTRSRGPVREVYREHCGTKSAALKRELAVKALSRSQKENLIDSAAACTEDVTHAQAFMRSSRMLGEVGMERLADARVMVLGLGGVGSNCVEALARGGVGHLILVDNDVVDASNINRQAIANTNTVGKRKTRVTRDMVLAVNPECDVQISDRFVFPKDLPTLIPDNVDYVIDAVDAVATKLALAEYAQDKPFTLISSMGAANKIHPESLAFADIFDTVNCPLCRIIRKECRKRGVKALRVLYSSEQPVPVATEPGSSRRDRSDLGTISYMPACMGLMIAGEVIRSILGDVLPQNN